MILKPVSSIILPVILSRSRCDGSVIVYRADNMRMGIRSIAIVAVTQVTKFQLKYFPLLLKKVYGFVNGRPAHCRVMGLKCFINLLCRGMVMAMSENSQNSKSLWRDTKLIFLETLDHLFQAFFRSIVV